MSQKERDILPEQRNDKGTYFKHGMGCMRWSNCYTCPYDDCEFRINKDLPCTKNRGNGIKECAN